MRYGSTSQLHASSIGETKVAIFGGGSSRENFFRCHVIFFKNFKIDILSQLEIWHNPVETKKFYRFFDLRTKKNYRFLKKIDVCP